MTKVLDTVNADPSDNIEGAWTPPSKQVSGSGKKSLRGSMRFTTATLFGLQPVFVGSWLLLSN